MPSTYTTNLGIEKIATGEQSGTWGTTTNTNLDLVDEAVNGIVTVTLAGAGSSGSPNTLAITNGASSDGRNKFIEFNDGGDLGGTAYVQLTPNDAEKIVHIRNSLSASRSILIFQGTYNASNDFEIPNGADVVLKFDGAGAGAVVSDVYVNLTPTKLTTANLVATTADINGGSVDGATLGTNSAITEAQIDNINIDGNAITSTDTNGNIALTPDGTGEVDISKVDIASGEIDGTNIGANSAGTGNFSTLSIAGTAITSTATELNILDGATATTAELNYLDISTLGTTEASKVVTADANGVVTFDNGKIEEVTAITSSSGTATLDLQDGDNFTHTLSENVTYTFSNPASSGKASAFTLKVVQDSTARTITWPASVDWAAATAPTLSTGNGDVDYFVFITTDGGTTYYGFTAGQEMG